MVLEVPEEMGHTDRMGTGLAGGSLVQVEGTILVVVGRRKACLESLGLAVEARRVPIVLEEDRIVEDTAAVAAVGHLGHLGRLGLAEAGFEGLPVVVEPVVGLASVVVQGEIQTINASLALWS